MMDEIALMWLRKRIADIDRRRQDAELRQIVADMKAAQIEAAPFIARAMAARQAAMRQDGPRGFTMVPIH